MPAAQANICIKRAYEEPTDFDGARVLVDRLWPRGISKQEARIDAWLRDLAPSNELRKWAHAHPEQWPEFRKRYLQELRNPSAMESLDTLYDLRSRARTVTLIFAAKNEERNNAVVLREMIERTKKPRSVRKAGLKRAAQSRQSRSRK